MSEVKNKRLYNGPSGVFYNATLDQIFELEYAQIDFMNLKTWKKAGKAFYWHPWQQVGTRKPIGVKMHDSVIRLGEL